MTFEERYSLLMKRVAENYQDILKQIDFSPQNAETQAEHIVMAKALRHYMESNLSDSAMDVEALLFYERPITEACEHFAENEVSVWNGLMEPFDRFVQDTKHNIYEVLEQKDAFSSDEVEKAQQYGCMESRVEKAERLMEQYHSNMADDLSLWNEYFKRYQEIKGETNDVAEKNVQAIYARMSAFDGLTAEQLHAMALLEEPLSAVYRCFTQIVQGDYRRTEEIDAAIMGMAKAQVCMLHHDQTRQEQEPDYEEER